MSPVPRGARLVLLGALVALAPAAFGGSAIAADVNADHLTNVPNAQPKQRGRVVPNKLSRELAEIPQASGADLLEGANPGVAPAFFGYSLYSDPDNPLVAIPPSTAEAHKTEPDKNTYLVLSGPGRLGRQHLAGRGQRRHDRRPCPPAELLRLPLRSQRHERSVGGRQAAGPAGRVAGEPGRADRLPRRPGGGRHRVAGHDRPAHLRPHVRHDVGHAPRHGHRRHRPVQRRRAGEGERRHPVQAPGERRLPPGHEVPVVRVHRDR